MRTWNLAPGDPLNLTLAADFRFCAPDYANDQIWELELGQGDPPALALHTTYGLRARSMRIFPRFTLNGRTLNDPLHFASPPRLRHFHPGLLVLDYAPFPGFEVQAEYWVPDSHAVLCRQTMNNRSGQPISVLLDICAQLVPQEGQPLAAGQLHSVNILSGRTADLAPVLFLTGGPQAGLGPYPGLLVDLAFATGGSRTLTWCQAALGRQEASFEHARRTASRPFDAERARIEMRTAADTIEFETGEPDWDAALAFSQTAGLRLFFRGNEHLPAPSFVLARQPDHGYSPRGDGSDHGLLWNGQPVLESLYLASNLPGDPDLARGLLRNFLSTQSGTGSLDGRPGLAGQRSRWLAAPLLSNLALQAGQGLSGKDFLGEVLPGLAAFGRAWLDPLHDRDLDGFPEWDLPAQSGLEDNPAHVVWHARGQGIEISVLESPALTAMLCAEFQAQAQIAGLLGQEASRQALEAEADRMKKSTEECWDPGAAIYRHRDRDTHRSPAGRKLASQRGTGSREVGQVLGQPTRLLVEVRFRGATMHQPAVSLHGRNGDQSFTEILERTDFHSGAGRAVATTHQLYTELEVVTVDRLQRGDQVIVSVAGLRSEDISLLLPVWAQTPDRRRLESLVTRTLVAPGRFGRPFGIPASPGKPEAESELLFQAVHLPWNVLLGEGLLAYGLQTEAVELLRRLMAAAIRNLKEQHAFAQAYHAETGAGLGERNAVQGLAPVGLFLSVLGVGIHSPHRVVLRGKNPFPSPVVVKYRGLTVTRQAGQTVVVFPNGQSATLQDPADGILTVEQEIA